MGQNLEFLFKKKVDDIKHMMNSLLESLLGTRIINFNSYLKTLHGSKYKKKILIQCDFSFSDYLSSLEAINFF